MFDKIKQPLLKLFKKEKKKTVGPINPQEKIIKANLLKLGQKSVEDVMIPRAEIQGMDVKTSMKDVGGYFGKYSRIPVYRQELDDVVSIVHVKDYLAHQQDSNLSSLETLGREPIFVPPSKNLLDMLLEMRVSQRHMAIVVDEYGGTYGLVTIEDILEEIVGEIEDEHDSYGESTFFVKMPEGKILVDARIGISDFENQFNLPPILSQEVEDHTMGGLLITLLGRLPQRNELIKHKGFSFEASKVTPRAVQKIIVHSFPKFQSKQKGRSPESDRSTLG